MDKNFRAVIFQSLYGLHSSFGSNEFPHVILNALMVSFSGFRLHTLLVMASVF